MKFFEVLKGSDLWIFIGIIIGGIIVTTYTAVQHYKSVKSGIEAEQAQFERDEAENRFRNRSAATDHDLINAQNIAIQKLQESDRMSKELKVAQEKIAVLQQEQNDYLKSKGSFCYIKDIKKNIYPMNQEINFILSTVGKYPLKNVIVEIDNLIDPQKLITGRKKSLFKQMFPSLISSRSEELGPILPVIFKTEEEMETFNIIVKISTDNETYLQHLSFIRVNFEWKKASLLVLKEKDSYKIILKKVDPEYLDKNPGFKWENLIFTPF